MDTCAYDYLSMLLHYHWLYYPFAANIALWLCIAFHVLPFACNVVVISSSCPGCCSKRLWMLSLVALHAMLLMLFDIDCCD